MNHYACPSCEQEWSDEWSSTSGDRCPACGTRNISPQDFDDLSVLVETTEIEGYKIFVSPPSAEDKPDYSLYRIVKNQSDLGPALTAALREGVILEA